MFHTCKTADDCARLREKLHARLSPENGGSDWMVSLLNEAYALALENFTMPSPDASMKMLNAILHYAENHETFNADFFKSVKESSEKYGGKLTDKQAQAVKNCYDKFKIGKK
jgi:hypothetical protein